MDYADLPTVDLSKADTPEGLSTLAVQVRDAMTEKGFFYVINHGLPFPEVSHLLMDKVLYAMTTLTSM